ncbi:hypothetical protein BDW75DRAFT_239259 [Aspergillus navahoensis]
MKVRPYTALSVLESLSLSTSILPHKTCPATGSAPACVVYSTPFHLPLHIPLRPLLANLPHLASNLLARRPHPIVPLLHRPPGSASDVSQALSMITSAKRRHARMPLCGPARADIARLSAGRMSTTALQLTSRRLNRTTYNEEKRIASIEPGARWKGVSIIINSLVHTNPFADPYPDAFAAFYLLPNISPDTTRQTELEGSVWELEPESGLHSNFFTVTFANDASILRKAVDIQERLIGEVKKAAKSDEWNIKSLYQPLPGLFAEIGRKNGGNVLRLDDRKDYIWRFFDLSEWWLRSSSGTSFGLRGDHIDDTALFNWSGETFYD